MALIITRIGRSQQQRHHYDIDVNEEYYVTVHEDLLVRLQLHKGKELLEEELEALQIAVEKNRAERLALHYLGYKARTTQQVRDYLAKKELSPATIENTLQLFQQKGYLQDEEYARQFVAERIRLRPRGRYLLGEELRQRGISEEISARVLSQLEADEELEACKRLAKKRLRRFDLERTAWREVKVKTIRHLQGKGFPYAVIRQALKQLEDEWGKAADEEWLS